ncbi:MAG: Rieske (2Fe-2S) protein [Candidatus Obscuribacter sp.]|jgi:Rieske Fe-S protein|nr:Rieske (2Fe-2S) protein [Candidatus Obscuribacter sp.]MDQ5967442.1 arsenite oxidase small subunit [Cyanobacteriota bacterium erpe_2018_sw_39hr_WHONDRS-SW48-000098_B_bin.30]MBK7838815.1 Rieske (2Fe-2S) protein [Candidatus Obscuribacter sp.]MBK9205435.1 Rieske (2Fe-2S) protein [Candidatus Obscuribacter sp.]MBK9619648.1 Rieske (2Fe-2S) protein [Candidatus Obscuribacter sp.]
MDQSRRRVLKFIAAAPMTLTFAFLGDGLLRYIKPTMKPFGVFDPADMPAGTGREVFSTSDFPAPWTCIPFIFRQQHVEFNSEKQVIKEIPAFAIRLAGDEIVAYSRRCPLRGCILNFRSNPRNCGCHPQRVRCCECAVEADNPVLFCPCDLSVFDLTQGGRVIQGPAPRPPRKFQLHRQGDLIAIGNLECGYIS